jgi:UDP-N-acetylglucosamine 2-epimerase
LIEAPALGVPTVNIGPRQNGRLRSASVIDCEPEEHAITGSINIALDPKFRECAAKMESPYGRGGASDKIKDILISSDLDGILMKQFYDIPGSEL